MPKRSNSVKDLLRKVSVIKATQCWLWRGKIGTSGYPQMSYKNVTRPAHRLAMHFQYGFDLESKDYIKRTCEHKTCVNPEHLYVFDRSQALEQWKKIRESKKIRETLRQGV